MISKDYMDGWNCGATGTDIKGRFRSKEAERGYTDYVNANPEDQIPFLALPAGSDRPSNSYVDACALLMESMETFYAYARLHEAKATDDGTKKAAANRAIAEKIDAFLNS